jgi:hypothetical protein
VIQSAMTFGGRRKDLQSDGRRLTLPLALNTWATVRVVSVRTNDHE